MNATTWFAAAKRGDVAELRRLLSVDKALAHCRDDGGRTVLHHLASAVEAAPGRAAEAAALAAVALVRNYDVDLDDVNPKTGAPEEAGRRSSLVPRQPV